MNAFFWSRPEDLVTKNRLDLMVRYAFAIAYLNEKAGFEDRTREFFEAQIRLLNPTSQWGENGTKFSPADYSREFRTLIEDMRSHGYHGRPISLAKDGSVADGAHRVAAALALGVPVKCVQTENLPHDYSANRLGMLGFEPRQISLLNLLSVLSCDDIRAMVLFGSDKSMETKVDNLLEEDIRVVCKAIVPGSDIVCRNLVRVSYGLNEWFTHGLLDKLYVERFRVGQPKKSTIWFVRRHAEKNPDIRSSKERIRSSILGLENFERRLHGTDNYLDTALIAVAALGQSGKSPLRSDLGSQLLVQSFRDGAARLEKSSLSLALLEQAKAGQVSEIETSPIALIVDCFWSGAEARSRRAKTPLPIRVWSRTKRIYWRGRVATSRSAEFLLTTILSKSQREWLANFIHRK